MLIWDDKYVTYARQRGEELREEVEQQALVRQAEPERENAPRIKQRAGAALSQVGAWLVRTGERLQASRVELERERARARATRTKELVR
jgi:hypothetical protein